MLDIDNVEQIRTLREGLIGVGTLQPMYTSVTTKEMKARGKIIRTILPSLIRTGLNENSIKQPDDIDDLAIFGSDGVGRKSEVPWVRVYSEKLSPSATTGWYVVYLFDTQGRTVYLSLNQGSTTLVKDSFVPRPKPEINARVNWARDVIEKRGISTNNYSKNIRLKANKSNLGDSYEVSNIYSVTYDFEDMPNEEKLREDLSTFLELLTFLYHQENRDLAVPGNTPVEIQEIIEITNEIAGKKIASRGGQGFKLSKQERDLIEKYAMEHAKKYYENLGWVLKDCSSTKPYDYLCEKDGKELYLEVKGTTSEGKSIILTRGEVKLMKEKFPNTALFILSKINLNKDAADAARLEVSGGIPYLVSPWEIDDDSLEAISYQYSLSSEPDFFKENQK